VFLRSIQSSVQVQKVWDRYLGSIGKKDAGHPCRVPNEQLGAKEDLTGMLDLQGGLKVLFYWKLIIAGLCLRMERTVIGSAERHEVVQCRVQHVQRVIRRKMNQVF
jgi:hypothetical protein